jgi:hypothetical protein
MVTQVCRVLAAGKGWRSTPSVRRNSQGESANASSFNRILLQLGQASPALMLRGDASRLGTRDPHM